MSQRWHWAVMSTDIYDLVALARLLTGAVQEAAAEGCMPHMDPAVRMISYQIAMAGNGDLPFVALYEKMYDYCAARAGQGPNFTYDAPPAEMPKYEPN